jgi:hypothetical protein
MSYYLCPSPSRLAISSPPWLPQRGDSVFEEFFGLPLHVLVIHLAVVVVPATATLAVVFAVFERWRWLLRWPLAVAAVGSLATVGVAVLSGRAFVDARPELAEVVAEHEQAGNRLLLFMVAFTVVALVAVIALGGQSALASRRGARRGLRRPYDAVVAGLLAVASGACIYQVIRTGDLGARAVWGG